jgi:N-acetylglucosamine-6-phosphate deacetylase
VKRHIHAAQAVVDTDVVSNICIEVSQGLISAISYDCTVEADRLITGTLIPGFVDIHCHGGGGFYFSDVDATNIEKARHAHRKRGTTTLLASLVTQPIGVLEEEIQRLIPLVNKGVFAGIHLEGPYLSEARCGAHQPDLLRSPEIEELSALIDCGAGTIVMVTLAPELDGGIEAIKYLTSRSVKVALGHSQASAATTAEAFKAGASLITHFTNGMPKLEDASGTITASALSASDIPLEIILDGAHLSDATLTAVKGSGKNRIILVTDAISAAGGADGHYQIGGLDVSVENGIARLDSNSSLAGSTLTMDIAFRNLLNSGSSLSEAVNAASTLPARTLGLNDVGSISVGKKAHLLELSTDNHITLIET